MAMQTQPQAALTKKDFAAIVVLSLFSFFVTSYGFLTTGGIYWDNALFFSLFRDNLHSLNEYGQVAWWFPHKQMGWPSYYYSILGDLSFSSPIPVVIGFVCWFLGRLGVTIENYQPLMIFHS